MRNLKAAAFPYATSQGIVLPIGSYFPAVYVHNLWVMLPNLRFMWHPRVHTVVSLSHHARKMCVAIFVSNRLWSMVVKRSCPTMTTTVPLDGFSSKKNILEKKYPSRSK
jgi:hypothetical protein